MKKLLSCLSLIGILLGSQPANASWFNFLSQTCACNGQPIPGTICPRKVLMLSTAMVGTAIIMHYGYARVALATLGSATAYMWTQAYDWWNHTPTPKPVSGTRTGSGSTDDEEPFVKGRE
jgi:hypothetical protein